VKQYFATLSTQELVNECGQKIGQFNRFLNREGWSELWSRSHDLYYGKHMGEVGVRASTVQDVGPGGAEKAFTVNHYRNLIQHMLALTCSQKPAYDPRAKNTDLKSIQQTRLATNILDGYVVEKRMGRYMYATAERSLVYGKGYTFMVWNPASGKTFSTQTVIDNKTGQAMIGEDGMPVEKVLYEGDPEMDSKSPWDVIYNPSLRNWDKNKWVIVRCWENKWDLAARHPDKAQDITKLTCDDALDSEGFGSYNRGLNDEDKDDELIATYHFFHLKTDALPNGRYMKFLNGDVTLYDGPTPYKKRLPVFRMVPGEVFDTADGYSNAFDTMQLQEVCDVLYSIPYSNQQATGIQLIHLPEGCEFSPSMFKSLAFLKGGAPDTKPSSIQLTNSPAEIFKNIEFIEAAMEKLSGVNSVVRGDPEHNLKSGAALGRIQAMAIQFASNFQKSWVEIQEDNGTFLLELLHSFAKTKRMAALAGKHNKGAMQAYTGDDLDMIDRVAVDLGNPLSRTYAGRLELADKLFEKGEINGRQYIQVATTGQLDAQMEGPESQLELIRKENESLMEGKPVKAVVGDAHLLHGQEHLTVINDPLIRELAAQGDQQALAIVSAVTMHLQEHDMLWNTQTPFFTAISGEPPAPPPPPMPGEVGPDGQPLLGPPPGPQMPEAPPIPPMPPMPQAG
jgi:hypothetical protein